MEERPDDQASVPEGAHPEVRDPVVRRHARQLLQIVEPVVAVARSVTGFFLATGLLSTLGSVVLLLVLFVPVEAVTGWKVTLIVLSASLLLSPGFVVLLFWVGLKQLVALPDDVADSLGDVEVGGARVIDASLGGTSGRGLVGRLVTLLRSLVDVRSALLQSRDVFAKGVVLVRIANPISLVVVLGATIASLLIVTAAALTALGILL